MTEPEKMAAGEYADVSVPEIVDRYIRVQRALLKLNELTRHMPGYRSALEEVNPGIPASAVICTPFHCDYGRVRMGENSFVNYNCSFLDGGGITIGDNTLIGPAVQIYTPHHPVDYIERRKPIERSLPVKIGSDCWIGGGAVITPGVTIGDRCIVAAGSVVVKDVPDDCLVAGNPAVIKRRLGENPSVGQ